MRGNDPRARGRPRLPRWPVSLRGNTKGGGEEKRSGPSPGRRVCPPARLGAPRPPQSALPYAASKWLPSPHPAKFLRRTYTEGLDDRRPSRGGEKGLSPPPARPPHPHRGLRPRRSGDQGQTPPSVGPSDLLPLAPATVGQGPHHQHLRSWARREAPRRLAEAAGRVHTPAVRPPRGSSSGGPSSPLPEKSFGGGRGVGSGSRRPGEPARRRGRSGCKLAARTHGSAGPEGGREGREVNRAAPKRGRKGPRRRARGAARRAGGRARRRPAPGAQVRAAWSSPPLQPAPRPPVPPHIPGLAALQRRAPRQR